MQLNLTLRHECLGQELDEKRVEVSLVGHNLDAEHVNEFVLVKHVGLVPFEHVLELLFVFLLDRDELGLGMDHADEVTGVLQPHFEFAWQFVKLV